MQLRQLRTGIGELVVVERDDIRAVGDIYANDDGYAVIAKVFADPIDLARTERSSR